MTTLTTHSPKRLPATFKRLVEIMVPHAITDPADYDNVSELLNRLALLPAPTPGQEQYLATLEALVDAYDRDHADPLLDARKTTPLERLQYLVKVSGTPIAAIGKIIGSLPAASMAINGKRELSKDHIRKLAAHFQIDAGYFL